ncbi:MAG: hypothetical protein E6G97_18395 [Alphaproteobacteria bacterium]|nr:MAG: hypothetical protein E6G97_18395 [Alphaproteobacteria bacterium]
MKTAAEVLGLRSFLEPPELIKRLIKTAAPLPTALKPLEADEDEEEEPAPKKPGPVLSHLRSMAGLKPGENFADKPLRSSLRFATTPVFDPWIRKNNPRLANAVRLPFALLPAVGLGSAAYSAATGAYQAANRAGDRMADYLQVPEADREPFKTSVMATSAMGPAMAAYGSYAPSWAGGDDTAVGDFHRSAFRHALVGAFRHGQYEHGQKGPAVFPESWRQSHGPYLAAGWDALRSTSPLGLMSTLAMRSSAKKLPPHFYRNVAGKAWADTRERFMADPADIGRSTLLDLYGLGEARDQLGLMRERMPQGTRDRLREVYRAAAPEAAGLVVQHGPAARAMYRDARGHEDIQRAVREPATALGRLLGVASSAATSGEEIPPEVIREHARQIGEAVKRTGPPAERAAEGIRRSHMSDETLAAIEARAQRLMEASRQAAGGQQRAP